MSSRLKGWLRHFREDRAGIAVDEVMWVMAWVVGGVMALTMILEIWTTFHVRQVLQQAGQIVDRSLVASGCLTTNAQDQLTNFLQSNGLDPSQVYLNANTTQQSYGARNLSATVGYDITYTVPFTSGRLWKRYTQVTVPSDQSQYVAGDGAGSSGCASSTTIAAAFGGTSNYGGMGGTGSTSTVLPTVTSLTLTSQPNPVSAGDPVTVSGVAMDGSNPAPAGTQVTLTSSLGTKAADVGSNGQFTTTYTVNTPGQFAVSGTAGMATASTQINVVASTAANLGLNMPSSIAVGQSFSIRVSAIDQYGNPVANGTAITISSSDSTDIPTVTLTTQNGVVTDPVGNGITALGTVTVTAKTGSISTSGTVQVSPGAPQNVSISASPTTIVAGQSVTLSGQVYGPDNTPPATGTAVKLTSASDTQDPLPTTTTNAQGQYNVGATLTIAGAQQVTAQVPSNGTTITSQPTTVTVNPGPAYEVVNLTASPDPVEQGATTTFTGVLEDSYGNTEPADVPVTISGGGLVKTLQTVTNSKGVFTVSGAFQGSGTQTVTLTSNGNSLVGGSLGVRVLPAGSYTLVASPTTTSIQAGQSATVAWTLTNSQGQPVANAPISFSLSPSESNVLTPVSGTTNIQGQISAAVGPLTVAQNYTLEAIDTATTNVTGAMSITVNPAAGQSVVDPPSISPSVVQSTQYGGTVDPVITGEAIDQYGNIIPNATITVTGGWDPGVDFTGTANAEGYFAVTLDPVVVGGPYDPTITIADSQGSSTTTYTNTTLTVVKTVYSLTLTPVSGSTNALTGTPYGVIASLSKNGSAVSGASITFSTSDSTATVANLYPSGPSGSGAGSLAQSSGTYQAGEAAVNVTLDQTGTQTIEATYEGVTAKLVVNASAPQINQVAWSSVSPNPARAGQTITVQGMLLSENGVPAGSGDTIKVEASGPTVQYATGIVQSNGIFSVTFNPSNSNGLVKAGTYSLSAEDMSQGSPFFVSAIGPGSVTVTPGPVHYLYPVLGPANNTGNTLLAGGKWNSSTDTMAYGTLPATDGSTVSTRFTAYDAYGNAVSSWSGGTVSCAASNGGSCPTMTQPSQPTNSQGQSGWANEGAFSPGSYTLTYTASSTGKMGTVTFTVPPTWVFAGLSGNGIYVAQSGSSKWTQQTTTSPGGSLIVDPNTQTLWTSSGEYLSAGATTWTANAPSGSGSVTLYDPAMQGMVGMGTGANSEPEIMYLSDSSKNWVGLYGGTYSVYSYGCSGSITMPTTPMYDPANGWLIFTVDSTHWYTNGSGTCENSGWSYNTMALLPNGQTQSISGISNYALAAYDSGTHQLFFGWADGSIVALNPSGSVTTEPSIPVDVYDNAKFLNGPNALGYNPANHTLYAGMASVSGVPAGLMQLPDGSTSWSAVGSISSTNSVGNNQIVYDPGNREMLIGLGSGSMTAGWWWLNASGQASPTGLPTGTPAGAAYVPWPSY